MERLQKRIAASGVASRRKAEELIKAGKVKVNDVVITEMGFLVKDSDIIKVNNEVITTNEKVYFVLNKPSGYICSVNDEKNRKTVIDILPDEVKKYNVFPIGRLDYDTKGVLLLTNDGDFMYQMVGPASGVEKEYLARVEGIVNESELSPLKKGLKYKGINYLPAFVTLESVDKIHNSSLVRIIITEGKNHQVKNMFEAINHKVKKLSRTRFGSVTLDNLPVGYIRPLTIHEIKTLYGKSKQEKNLRMRG